jgi:hypothetical protein
MVCWNPSYPLPFSFRQISGHYSACRLSLMSHWELRLQPPSLVLYWILHWVLHWVPHRACFHLLGRFQNPNLQVLSGRNPRISHPSKVHRLKFAMLGAGHRIKLEHSCQDQLRSIASRLPLLLCRRSPRKIVAIR